MAVEAEAMSAEHSAGSFHEAEGERWWSIPLLFLMVLVVDVLVEVLNEWVMHAMEARHMTALIRAWTQLKFEIMALGVVSLLLVVFEVRVPPPSGMDSWGLLLARRPGAAAAACSSCAISEKDGHDTRLEFAVSGARATAACVHARCHAQLCTAMHNPAWVVAFGIRA